VIPVNIQIYSITEMKEKFFKDIKAFFDDAYKTIERKNADYANDNPFSNFEGISHISGIPTDFVFLQFIIVKVLRLAELAKKGEAKNESLDDSLKDLVNYSALWKIFRDK